MLRPYAQNCLSAALQRRTSCDGGRDMALGRCQRRGALFRSARARRGAHFRNPKHGQLWRCAKTQPCGNSNSNTESGGCAAGCRATRRTGALYALCDCDSRTRAGVPECPSRARHTGHRASIAGRPHRARIPERRILFQLAVDQSLSFNCSSVSRHLFDERPGGRCIGSRVVRRPDLSVLRATDLCVVACASRRPTPLVARGSRP